ncbi:DUF4241 domain-containing protein [Actibacterium sp. 188UL27-1]|uniref:DUF4241 domain-containing protein n=1 Tax=Actibacterium sp. 188UL27-1 TaxID=2786961 RepID=UPI00195CDDCF|nr:DUF4241 domain-containing protein [Actibacterium sp. 188UL27-1]
MSGGADIGTWAVDAGMTCICMPTTHAAMEVFLTSKPDMDPHDDYFADYDDSEGAERKIFALPDGTPVPYIQSGWGDVG